MSEKRHPETQAFTLRMARDEYEALKAYAFVTEAPSINDVIVRAVREFLAKDGRREEFNALLGKMRSQYRLALDKLVDL